MKYCLITITLSTFPIDYNYSNLDCLLTKTFAKQINTLIILCGILKTSRCLPEIKEEEEFYILIIILSAYVIIRTKRKVYHIKVLAK